MKLLIAVLPLLLSACATPFVQSTHPQAATVTIRNATPFGVGGFAFSNPANCSGYLNFPFPPSSTHGGKALAPGAQMQLSVDPDRKFAFSLGSGRPPEITATKRVVTMCGVIATFLPQPQKRYLIDYRWPGDECSVSILRVDSVAGEDILVPEASAEQRQENSGFVNPEACK